MERRCVVRRLALSKCRFDSRFRDMGDSTFDSGGPPR